MWRIFKDGVLKACDEMCGIRFEEDIWWWSEQVKGAAIRKKHIRLCFGTVLRRIRGGKKA